jgi:hypothetical protein
MNASSVKTRDYTLDALRHSVRRGPGILYAIVDACDASGVPEKMQSLGVSKAVSLYRGSAERDFWAIAPYLVQVDEQFLEWLIENIWDHPWGILAFAPADLASVRTHFRRFLKVQGPDGDELYFRFYDPRVLPTFLRTCTIEERTRFFGPITAFCVKGDYENRRDDALCLIEPA